VIRTPSLIALAALGLGAAEGPTPAPATEPTPAESVPPAESAPPAEDQAGTAETPQADPADHGEERRGTLRALGVGGALDRLDQANDARNRQLEELAEDE